MEEGDKVVINKVVINKVVQSPSKKAGKAEELAKATHDNKAKTAKGHDIKGDRNKSGESGRKSLDEMFTDKSVKHLEKIDGFDKKHGGIKGAHTMDSFNKFSEEVRPVQIVNKTKISDGIYAIKYKVAKMDRGKPIINADGTYDLVNAEYVKTVIDTSELNIDKIVSMAKEAFDSRELYITPGKQMYINGISKDEVKFEGWINSVTNELDSFYPVMEWKFEY